MQDEDEWCKGASQKKNTGFFGSFSQMWDPPHPPYLEGLRPKKKINGLFCVLGLKEHFCFLQKCSLFVSILEKLPKNPVFADFFP